MKTHELLTLPEKEAVAAMKQLKLKELERHAVRITQKKCGGDYDEVLRIVIKAVPNLSENGGERFEEVKNLIHLHSAPQQTLKNAGTTIPSSTLERLTALMMLIIAKKFEAIHTKR